MLLGDASLLGDACRRAAEPDQERLLPRLLAAVHTLSLRYVHTGPPLLGGGIFVTVQTTRASNDLPPPRAVCHARGAQACARLQSALSTALENVSPRAP